MGGEKVRDKREANEREGERHERERERGTVEIVR